MRGRVGEVRAENGRVYHIVGPCGAMVRILVFILREVGAMGEF